jgi:hypothetical protein
MSLTQEEYDRRQEFASHMKKMDKNAFIEIARILKKNDVVVSENRSGMFFDLVKIPQKAFEDLVQFRAFVDQNTKELEKRRVANS